MASGRVDIIERRFGQATLLETVNMLRRLLKWGPSARWTSLEALGK